MRAPRQPGVNAPVESDSHDPLARLTPTPTRAEPITHEAHPPQALPERVADGATEHHPRAPDSIRGPEALEDADRDSPSHGAADEERGAHDAARGSSLSIADGVETERQADTDDRPSLCFHGATRRRVRTFRTGRRLRADRAGCSRTGHAQLQGHLCAPHAHRGRRGLGTAGANLQLIRAKGHVVETEPSRRIRSAVARVVNARTCAQAGLSPVSSRTCPLTSPRRSSAWCPVGPAATRDCGDVSAAEAASQGPASPALPRAAIRVRRRVITAEEERKKKGGRGRMGQGRTWGTTATGNCPQEAAGR